MTDPQPDRTVRRPTAPHIPPLDEELREGTWAVKARLREEATARAR